MYFPLMIQLDRRQVVVVGGGEVAWRKCRLFADFGARVVAVAPEFSPEFQGDEQIGRIGEHYRPEHLAGADIVIAATDDRALNRAVYEFCCARRIPVNVVDDPELCSFIVPATVRRGDLVLSVSTGGKSPALAAGIRRQLEREYGPELEERLELLGEIRGLLLAADLPAEERRTRIIASARLETEQLHRLKAELENGAG